MQALLLTEDRNHSVVQVGKDKILAGLYRHQVLLADDNDLE